MNPAKKILVVLQLVLLGNYLSAQKEQLLFNSGFESGTKLVSKDAKNDDLTGVDKTVPAPNDWDRFSSATNGYKDAGAFKLYFEGGDSNKRKVRLVPDPVNPSNTALKFVIYEPNVVKHEDDTAAYKSRVQAQVNGASPGVQKYYQSIRIYFPSSTMNVLKNYPDKLTWYSIAEFWNNAAWGKAPKDPYRLTVGVNHAKGAENPFYFHFSCDKYRIKYKEDGTTPEKYIPTDIANKKAESFPIPFDTWITVEYYYQEGNWKATAQRPAGHFYMSVQPEGGKKQILFNERVATIHPDQTIDPDGLTSIHPMKFYTSKLVGDFMKQQHTPLEVLWDDLKMYSGKIPDEPILKEALAKP